jgi:GAF domain-containing protein
MQTTYCSIVGETQSGLAVDDAELDDRVHTHPARERYAAYCGVPLRDRDGESFGTLCHYDPRPRIGTSGQLELLDRVAPLVARYVLSRAG